jgi:hypothetical protein
LAYSWVAQDAKPHCQTIGDITLLAINHFAYPCTGTMDQYDSAAVLKQASDSLLSNKGDPTAARDIYFDTLSEWVMALEDAEDGAEAFPQNISAVESLWCGYAGSLTSVVELVWLIALSLSLSLSLSLWQCLHSNGERAAAVEADRKSV